ncbi:MAG: acyltransferase family protein [Nocardiaceae bacterium]|nr:acyltransferase family protein [Nocardiaceae bacterium]
MRLEERRKLISTTRVPWVDVAKGTSIVLVVLLHSTNFLLGHNLASWFWDGFNTFLEPIRMPLFFLASGLFAQNILKTSWRAVVRKRIALFVWLYVLWIVIRFTYFTLLPSTVSTGEIGNPWMMLQALFVPNSGLWFLYALALYAVLAKVLAYGGMRLSMGVGLGFALAAPYLSELSWAWARTLQDFVFFLLGLHAREIVVAISRKATWVWFAIAIAAFTGLKSIRDHLHMPLASVAVVSVVVSVVGLAAGVCAAVLVQHRLVGRGLARLGAITLPIYLMHEMILGALAGQSGVQAVLAAHPLMFYVSPVLLAGVSIFMALTLHRVLRRVGFSWLFVTPRPLLAVLPSDPPQVVEQKKLLAAAA